MTEFGKLVKSSLIYVGQTESWLAEQLGVSKRTINYRYKDDMWTLPQIRTMKAIFRWKSLEG